MVNRKEAVKSRDISLGEVLYSILHYWRLMILVIIAAALCVGLFGYSKSVKKEKSTTKKYNEYIESLNSNNTVNAYDSNMSEEQRLKLIEDVSAMSLDELLAQCYSGQINAVNLAVLYARKFQDTYRNPIYRFNRRPDCCFAYDFVFDADKENFVEEADFIISRINSEDWMNYIENPDILPANYSRCIYANPCVGNTIRVYAYFENGDEYPYVEKSIITCINEAIKAFTINSGKETEDSIIGMNFAKSLQSFDYFCERQDETITTCDTNLNLLSGLRGFFTIYQQALYNKYTWVWPFDLNAWTPPAPADGSEAKPKEIKIVKARFKPLEFAIGAAGGLLIWVFVSFALYFFSSKLKLSDDSMELFNLYSFGRIAKPDNRKKWFWRIDNAISRLRYMKGHYFEETEAVKLIVSGIKVSLAKAGVNSVALMGVSADERTLKICDSIIEALSKDNIVCKVINNSIYDAESVLKVSEVEATVLFETTKLTKYFEILSEIEMFEHENVNILGMVLVEG